MIRGKSGVIGLLAALIAGCSSAPEKVYEVRTYQRISNTWMVQADRKRQLEQYDQALLLYQRALQYASKRNDLFDIGIAKLKSAAIHIQLKQYQQAENLLAQVSQMNEYEPVELDNPIKFIRAKLLQATGETPAALALLAQLEQSYLSESERNIYYRLVRWSYQPESVAATQVEADLSVLDELVAQQQLQNIEIYSFALFEHAKWLVAQQSNRAEAAINKALKHFSSLELTAKIKGCYLLAVDYYKKIKNSDKVEYFKQRAEILHEELQ